MAHLAVFDFDNTIVSKDTLFDFLRYSTRFSNYLFKIAVETPSLVSFKLGKISGHHAKERLLSRFYKGSTSQHLSDIMTEYSRNRIPQILNHSVYDRIQWHKQHNHHLLIASASIDEWIRPWAENEGFHHIIATKLAFCDGQFSGKLHGKNCSGEEKVKRLERLLPDLLKHHLYVYSDNWSDLPLFQIAHEPFYVGKSGMVSPLKGYTSRRRLP